MDYDQARGDYRLGHCNRTETSLSAHLACRTTANGTWHGGGMQLVWVGQSTLLRYAQATGEYSLWHYSSAPDQLPFEDAPLSEGVLLRADGKRVRDARLTRTNTVMAASAICTGWSLRKLPIHAVYETLSRLAICTVSTPYIRCVPTE